MNRTCFATVRETQGYPQFSEQEILDLQELFLTYGYHHLTAASVAEARTIISLFLETFPHLARVACLTSSSLALPESIVRLYDELAFEGALAFDHHQLDDFLVNKFYYDFLWIECSDDLLQAPWFYYFEKKLHDYNLIASLPIVLVSYK